MGALTKRDLTDHLVTSMGIEKELAKTFVELFFDEIRACLASNQDVKLSGFGNFELRNKKSRPGRNPKTGEEIPIQPRRVVSFKPGQKLKQRIEANSGFLVQQREDQEQ